MHGHLRSSLKVNLFIQSIYNIMISKMQIFFFMKDEGGILLPVTLVIGNADTITMLCALCSHLSHIPKLLCNMRTNYFGISLDQQYPYV